MDFYSIKSLVEKLDDVSLRRVIKEKLLVIKNEKIPR